MLIRNSIIWGNTAEISESNPDPNIFGEIDAFVFSYTLVEKYTPSGTYNLSGNPKFISPMDASSAPTSDGNYRLKSDSPAINAGSDEYYLPTEMPDLSGITTDLDGNLRFAGSAVDLGAYETLDSPITINAVTDTVLTTAGTPVKIWVLANDDLGSCSGDILSGF
jgi:hypothetical protein